jgi:hypothetical protein
VLSRDHNLIALLELRRHRPRQIRKKLRRARPKHDLIRISGIDENSSCLGAVRDAVCGALRCRVSSAELGVGIQQVIMHGVCNRFDGLRQINVSTESAGKEIGLVSANRLRYLRRRSPTRGWESWNGRVVRRESET